MKILKIATLFISFFLTSVLLGQTFTLTVQNQLVSGTDFTYDIYMKHTGGDDIYLGDSDFVLTFNHTNFTNPTYVKVSSGLGAWYTVSTWAITADNRAILNVYQPSFSDPTEFDDRVTQISSSGNGTCIASVKITGISNTSGTAGLQWRTSGDNMTQINRLDNFDPWDEHNINSSGTYTSPSDYSLPVQMTNLMATASQEEGIVLTWRTESEVSCAGFHLWRSEDEESEYERITTALISGHGNSSTGHEYSYTDRNVEDGVMYWYKIEEVSTDGSSTFHGPVSVVGVSPIPTEFGLSQNYPNPFNPETAFKYTLPEDSEVSIRIYDLLGKEVKTLVGKHQQAGYYTETWDGLDDEGRVASSGIYFILMEAGHFRKVQKITFLK